MPIQVSGVTAGGVHFSEAGETLVVNAHGATIVLNKKLDPGQPITLHCPQTGKAAAARIVGQVKEQRLHHVYGVVLLEPEGNPWDIDFPPVEESRQAFSRLLLECGECYSRELAALNELEAEVFDTSGNLSRSCKHCSSWTLWTLAVHEGPVKAKERHPPKPKVDLRSRNERKHIRLRMKMRACIRRPGLGEEVVEVENVSRSGLLFLSANHYKKGTWVEVAAPYTPGAANVFIPARIVRDQQLSGADRRKYGAEYMKIFKEEREF